MLATRSAASPCMWGIRCEYVCPQRALTHGITERVVQSDEERPPCGGVAHAAAWARFGGKLGREHAHVSASSPLELSVE